MGWLLAGPFPDPGAFDLKGKGFAAVSACETGSVPVESGATELLGERSNWKFRLGDKNGIDLNRYLPNRDSSIGYCFTKIYTEVSRSALLLFGSDDGAKVFLNGKQVFAREVARGIKRDEETVPIQLKAGTNLLLFKVEQLNRGWGLLARIVDGARKPIPSVYQELSVVREISDEISLARTAAGSLGVLDASAVLDYIAIRASYPIWLKNLHSYAIDADKFSKDLTDCASGVEKSRGGSATLSQFLKFGNRKLHDDYTHSRARLLAWAQHPGPLKLEADPDVIRVMNGGRYFAHPDGTAFTPIGYNHNPDWTELEFANPLNKDYNPGRADKWFANLESHGVNVIRMMVETPPSGNLEESPGVFRPEHVLWLDTIVTAAAKHHVKLWMTPYDTFWMSLRADASPYWAANGGPIVKPIDFLTKSSVFDLQKKRIKFLIDRYGATGILFAWEIMNEIDLWWSANPTQIRAWVDRMAPFVREYQRRRWGTDRMLTLSFAEPETKGLNAETQFRRSDLDFATMHLYLGASRAPAEGDATRAADDFAAGVTYARSQIRDNRPVMDGESGPIDRWVDSESLDDEVFHQMSWAHLLAGGAGGGTRWPYRNPHHLTQGMLNTLAGMRTFCDHVPWAALNGPESNSDLTISGTAVLNARKFATARGCLIWLKLDSSSKKNYLIDWKSKDYSFQVFDVKRKQWMGPKQSGSGPQSFDASQTSGEVALYLAQR